MKRSAFKRKPSKPMKRTAIKRAGKKTNEWDRVRGLMKVQFSKSGIETCELQYPGCWRDNGLGFAHSKKRRNIVGTEIEEAILAYSCCHDKIEILKEGAMGDLVRGVISRRRTPVASVF